MRLIALCCIAVAVSGCAAVNQQSKNNALETTLVAYANALRWGDIEQALPFIDAETQKAHPLTPLDMQRYKQVHIASYIEQTPVPVGQNEVRQAVRIMLVNVNTQTEREIVDNQLWRYDEKTKHWHNVSGLPDITHTQP